MKTYDSHSSLAATTMPSYFNSSIDLCKSPCATIAIQADQDHCFLVLEKAQGHPAPAVTQSHIMITIDFVYNTNSKDMNSSASRSSAECSGDGLVLVKRLPTGLKYLEDTFNLAKLEGVSYALTEDQFNAIAKRVTKDCANCSVRYNIAGRHVASESLPSEVHNCITYIISLLKEEAGINISAETWSAHPFIPFKIPRRIVCNLQQQRSNLANQAATAAVVKLGDFLEPQNLKLGDSDNDDSTANLTLQGQVKAFLQGKHQEIFKVFMSNGLCNAEVYLPPLGSFAEDDGDEQHFDLIQRLTSDIHEEPNSSFVVLGDSGHGKSLLGLILCCKYWEQTRLIGAVNTPSPGSPRDDRIPIFIYLPDMPNDCKNLLQEYFSPLTPAQLEIARKLKYLLILDSFDELPQKSNLFKLQEKKWGWDGYAGRFLDVKTLILTRKQTLSSKEERDELFKFDKVGQSNAAAAGHLEYFLQPFTPAQINEFVQAFVALLQNHDVESTSHSMLSMVKKITTLERRWEQNSDEYFGWFGTFPDLYSLASTPLLLKLILCIMPKMLHPFRQEELTSGSGRDVAWQMRRLQRLQQLCSTKTGIYDEFTGQWFEFQVERIQKSKVPRDLFSIAGSADRKLIKLFYVYAENLAARFLYRSHFADSIGLGKTLDWTLCDPYQNPELKTTCEQLFPNPGTEDAMEDVERKIENLKSLRDGCLLQFSSNGQTCRFFHRSLLIYFASKYLFELVEMIYQCWINNNDAEASASLRPRYEASSVLYDDFLEEQDIIVQLANRVKKHDQFVRLLLDIVLKSKELPSLAILASNSTTILNAGGFNFSSLNLQDIQIPRAKLDRAILGWVDFRGADLQGVSLLEAWMPQVQFQGANLRNSNFGIPSSGLLEGIQNEVEGKANQIIPCPSAVNNRNCGSDQTISWMFFTKGESEIYRIDNDGQNLQLLSSTKYSLASLSLSVGCATSRVVGIPNDGLNLMIWELHDEIDPVQTVLLEEHGIRWQSSPELKFKLAQHRDYIVITCSRQVVIFQLCKECDLTLVSETNLPDSTSVIQVWLQDANPSDSKNYDVIAYLAYSSEDNVIIVEKRELPNSKSDHTVTQTTTLLSKSWNFLDHISAIQFGDLGVLVVVGSKTGHLVLLQKPGRGQDIILKRHEEEITNITWRGSFFCTNCAKKLIIWEYRRKQRSCKIVLTFFIELVNPGFSFSLDSFWMTCIADNYVDILKWKLTPTATVSFLPEELHGIDLNSGTLMPNQLAVGTNGEYLAVSLRTEVAIDGRQHEDDVIQLNTLMDGKAIQCLAGSGTGQHLAMDFVDDQKLLIIGLSTPINKVRLYLLDVCTKEVTTCMELSNGVNARNAHLHLGKSELGKRQGRVAIVESNGRTWEIKILPFSVDLKSGAIDLAVSNFRLTRESKVSAVALTLNKISVAFEDCSLELWSCATNQLLSKWGQANVVNGINFTHNDSILVATTGNEFLCWSTYDFGLICANARYIIAQHVALIVNQDAAENVGSITPKILYFLCYSLQTLLILGAVSGPQGEAEMKSESHTGIWFLIKHCMYYQRAADNNDFSSGLVLCAGSNFKYMCCLSLTHDQNNCWRWKMLWSKTLSENQSLDRINVTASFADLDLKERFFSAIAVGQPTTQTKYTSFAELFTEIEGTTITGDTGICSTIMVVDQLRTPISSSQWAIFVAAKKKQEDEAFGKFGNAILNMDLIYSHVFFIVEGVRNSRRFLIFADLIKNGVRMFPYCSLDSVETWNKFRAYKTESEKWQGQVYAVSASQGMKFLKSIHQDKQAQQIYNVVSKLPKSPRETSTEEPSAPASLNCASWAKSKLRVIGKEFQVQWHNKIIDLPSDLAFGDAQRSLWKNYQIMSIGLWATCVLVLAVLTLHVIDLFI